MDPLNINKKTKKKTKKTKQNSNSVRVANSAIYHVNSKLTRTHDSTHRMRRLYEPCRT